MVQKHIYECKGVILYCGKFFVINDEQKKTYAQILANKKNLVRKRIEPNISSNNVLKKFGTPSDISYFKKDKLTIDNIPKELHTFE